jgi:16S rRNA (guanine966-N2)-methyltransferase
MRIIAGRFRGRRLANFNASHIRPTTDRVKESIFNKLQGYVDGARVLDLFAGTGNLTCEAISRGAVSVDSVELSKKSIAIIRENLKLLEIEDEVQVICDDVLKYLKRYAGPAYDLILADPPFTEKLAHSVLEQLGQSAAVGPDTVIMIESSSHERVEPSYKGLTRTDERDYGDKRVSFWTKASEESSDSSDSPPAEDPAEE